jgi:hypothetical protein
LASDALVSISYSGLAHINRIPTDLFIDRVLGELQHQPKISHATHYLCSRLEKKAAGNCLVRQNRLDISLNGWQWKNRETTDALLLKQRFARITPIKLDLNKPAGAIEIHKTKRALWRYPSSCS